MSIPLSVRATVRTAFAQRCGYCGIHERQVGSELEIEHFQPVVHGGADEIDNLVYTCTACNRFKGSYWPEAGTPSGFWLLHPLQDDASLHITEAANGRLVGLTPRGWFHIQWLHLNRPQLVEWRILEKQEQELRDALVQAEGTMIQLQNRIHELEAEIAELQAIITRLAG